MCVPVHTSCCLSRDLDLHADWALQHYNHLERKLREQFQAGLVRLLQAPEIQNVQQLMQMSSTVLGHTHDPSTTVLPDSRLDEMFVHGDTKLAWDLWAPILDALPAPHYLAPGESGQQWGRALLASAITVLNWLLTMHFGGINDVTQITAAYISFTCSYFVVHHS
jgi:hypothetical protein